MCGLVVIVRSVRDLAAWKRMHGGSKRSSLPFKKRRSVCFSPFNILTRAQSVLLYPPLHFAPPLLLLAPASSNIYLSFCFFLNLFLTPNHCERPYVFLITSKTHLASCLLLSARGFISRSCCFSLYPFMLVEWILNTTTSHPYFFFKLFIWVNSPVF